MCHCGRSRPPSLIQSRGFCLKYVTSHLVAVLAAIAASGASAEEASSQQSRWGLGLGAIASDNPYAGRGTRYTPFPLITYDSNRLFFEGITGGVHLLDTSSLDIDLIAEPNFDGIDADQFGVRELGRNRIDRDLLADRK